MPSIDWKLRDALPYLRDNGRLNVLMALVLRANVRARCWPSMELICHDTGYAIEAVNAAKKWLISHGAIEMVEYSKRVGKECQLPPRQSVYQLTGELVIGDKTFPYLYVSPTEISENEVLPVEISPIEDEVVKSVKSLELSKSRKEKKEQIASASDADEADEYQSLPVGKKQKAARAEKAETRMAAITATTPIPPTPLSAPRKVNAAEELGKAYGIMPVGPKEWKVYGQVAKDLMDGTVTPDQFPQYVAWRRKDAVEGRWKFTITSLTSAGAVSAFVQWRDEKAQAQAQQNEANERLWQEYPQLRPGWMPDKPASPEKLKLLEQIRSRTGRTS